MRLRRKKFGLYPFCRKNLKIIYSTPLGRILFWINKNAIYGLLIISFATIVIIVFNIFRVKINVSNETANDLNEILKGLSLSIMAACIFYFINDYLPHYRNKKSERIYIHDQFNEIKSILESEIRTIAFKFDLINVYKFPTKDEFVKIFIQKYISNNSYIKNQCYNDCINIHSIVNELLRFYGRILNYDEISKLDYLSRLYNQPVQIDIPLIDIEGKIEYVDKKIKFVAYRIYNAYEVVKNKSYTEPEFPEDEELEYYGQHNICNCCLKGAWCFGHVVDNSE